MRSALLVPGHVLVSLPLAVAKGDAFSVCLPLSGKAFFGRGKPLPYGDGRYERCMRGVEAPPPTTGKTRG